MKVPSALLWGLTKQNNAFVVRRNGQEFTRDPSSLTNLHNASQSGLANDNAVSIGLIKGAKGSKGVAKRIFVLRQRHSGKHSKAARAGLVFSTQNLTKEVNRAAKVIDTLTVSPAKKAALKERLHRLHQSNTLHQKTYNLL